MRILVAEDERINQLFLRQLLAREGHELTLASDGAAALQLADDQSFDLLLLDIHMPELDGDEVARRVRNGECAATSNSVPMLAMTALLYDSDREPLLAAGFTDIISKPFQDTVLLSMIHTTTNRTNEG